MNARQSRLLFVALVVGQLIHLSTQARDPGGSTSLLEGTLLRALAPFGRLVATVGDAFGGVREAARTRASLEQENRALRTEVTELRRERLRWGALELEAADLARGSGLAADRGFTLRAARVVYFDRHSSLRTLVLQAGGGAVRVDQPVVAEAGVVGRVVEVAGSYAKVQLLTDRAASAGVLLEGARRQGILRGAGPGRLEVDYVPRQVEVRPGDRVVTAGIDGVYPRGLDVGVVVEVADGDETFHRVVVRPAVDFGNLAVIYLLETEAVPFAEQGAGRSAGR